MPTNFSIQLYAPEKEPDGSWHARARVVVPGGGVFEVDGRADASAAASLLARMNAWRCGQGLKPAVGGFWEDLGKGITTVTSNPIFKGAVQMATSAIPVVGPVLAATGVTNMAIDAANGAVNNAISKSAPPAAQQAAKQEIKNIQKRAQQGNPRSRKALETLRTVHTMKKRGIPLKSLRGLSRGRALLDRAGAGDLKAQRGIMQMIEAAKEGTDDRAAEALGYLAAAQEMVSYYDPEPVTEEDYSEWVGASVRDMSDAELVALLRKLGQRRKGHRAEAQRTVQPQQLNRRASA